MSVAVNILMTILGWLILLTQVLLGCGGVGMSILGYFRTRARWPHALRVWSLLFVFAGGVSVGLGLIAVQMIIQRMDVPGLASIIGLVLVVFGSVAGMVCLKAMNAESSRYGSIEAGLVNLHW